MASALHVIDLGLDYKSFAKFVDRDGRPLLSNQFHFPIADIATKFVPTCGLLSAVLHSYAASFNTPQSMEWLNQYRRLQAKLFDETKSVDAANALSFLAQNPKPLPQQLLTMLDAQVNMTGNNAPSRRPVNGDAKHALCNLNLMDHACHQGLQCNQLHQAQPGALHRQEFFAQVARTLKAAGLTTEEIRNRLEDVIFFAKYSNKVTVEQAGKHYMFFKSGFSEGRVRNALRLDTSSVVIPPGTNPSNRPMKVNQDSQMIVRELHQQSSKLLDEIASPTTRQWNAVVTGFVGGERKSPQAVPIAPAMAHTLAQLPLSLDESASPDVSFHFTPLMKALSEISGTTFHAATMTQISPSATLNGASPSSTFRGSPSNARGVTSPGAGLYPAMGSFGSASSSGPNTPPTDAAAGPQHAQPTVRTAFVGSP